MKDGKILKLKNIIWNQNTVFLFLTLIMTGLYAGFLYNQTLPFAEGWYTYYAECINKKGLMPYRDFEFLYSPIYIYFIAIVTRIFGYNLIILRTMGILMFCIIAVGLYLSIQLIVGKERSWIACVAAVTAAFYMQSEVVQIFYDYVRLMDIISIYTVFFLLKTVKRMAEEVKYVNCLLGTGICCSFLINIKQNVGIIFCVYTLVLLIYLGLYYRKKVKSILTDIIIFLLPIVAVTMVMYIILSLTGSLSNYMQATGAGAVSAKGGMLAILFKWIPNNWASFKAGFPFARNILAIIAVVFATNSFLVKKYGKYDKRETTEKYLGVLFGVFGIIFLFKIKSSEEFTRNMFSNNYLSPYTVFLMGIPIFILIGIWGVINIFQKKKQIDAYMLLFVLAGSYFAIAYSCGNSGGLAEGQTTLGIALIVTILLSLFDYKWERFFKIAIVFVCLGLTLQSAGRKMLYTYNWWGMDESNFWNSCQTTDLPLLDGIAMSSDTKHVYESIYRIIMENTTEEDAIFCFPQIPLFYSMTGRDDPGTRSKVQWFDVSTDNTVIQDIEVIRQNRPKVIVMYNTSEFAYLSHEKSFREGKLSGTRSMREFLYNYVYENQYLFYGRFTANSNVIQVWVKNDEEKEEISVFSGGNGTYENPYLIETAEQLMVFGKMVNEGRSFEGSYIRQIEDIDLSSIENWESIGKFGGESFFYGTYDGAGHVIKNLTSVYTDDDYNLGLFGQLGGKVYNLGLEGGDINGLACGGIASHTIGYNAAIVNCYSDIDVVGFRAGGIADNFQGTVANCISVGKLTGIESANIVSYCANEACYLEHMYVLNNSINSMVYNDMLHDGRINYCEEEYMNSIWLVNSLNDYVDSVNENILKQSEDSKEIMLIHWEIGADGHPVYVF